MGQNGGPSMPIRREENEKEWIEAERKWRNQNEMILDRAKSMNAYEGWTDRKDKRNEMKE